MSLSEKQRLFARYVGMLITWCYKNGYELTLGEAERSTAQALANAAKGTGIANSLHLIKLAIDLHLFIDGKYQPDTPAYKPLGEYWKSLDPLCAWGGDFKRADGNHFSLSHEGVK
jgi:hypothetical protein